MREMKEHDTTIEVLRKEYDEKVQQWLGKNYTDYADNSRNILEVVSRCTTLQLHAMGKLIDRNPPGLKILGCDPTDHLAVTFAGMYVGIEVDGYTHS